MAAQCSCGGGCIIKISVINARRKMLIAKEARNERKLTESEQRESASICADVLAITYHLH